MGTIYIDVLFFVNFIINLTILNTQAILLRHPAKLSRLFLGACLGAFYACGVFILSLPFLSSWLVKICFCILTAIITFGRKNIKNIFKNALIFFALTVFFGICTLAVLYFTSIGIRLGGFVKNGVFYFDVPLWYVMLSSLGTCTTTIICNKIFRNSPEKNCIKLCVSYKGKKVTLKALVDTGNTLKDPFNGQNVIIAEAKALSPLFDFDISFAKDRRFENLPLGLRLIPFSSIGNPKGLMASFVPDFITAEGKALKSMTAAIFWGVLSHRGDYNALIGPDMNFRKETEVCLKKEL